MGFLLDKGEFSHYLCNVTKKNKVMKKLLLLKHIETKAIMALHFKNEEEAISWWINFENSEMWDVIYDSEREESNHRYNLIYAKSDEEGKRYPKYIICFSKKEAVFLREKIKKENPDYIFDIEKIY